MTCVLASNLPPSPDLTNVGELPVLDDVVYTQKPAEDGWQLLEIASKSATSPSVAALVACSPAASPCAPTPPKPPAAPAVAATPALHAAAVSPEATTAAPRAVTDRPLSAKFLIGCISCVSLLSAGIGAGIFGHKQLSFNQNKAKISFDF